jgi:hypothetical protein
MRWLERHAWWGLALMTVLVVIFGVTDVLSGPSADVAIPMSLTGLTLAELEAESAAAYRLFDFFTRVNGWSLIMLGLLTTAVLVFAYRRHQRWAWWTMWLLPAWGLAASLFYVVAGLAPGQPPPPPMLSGPIIAVLAAAILLVSARPFFRQPDPA